jgi:radical SAM protein with 4Fe4S-binding SPASM domain
MASYAEEHQVKVELNTNATLLDREKSEELLRSGISHVSFAFDGFKREMYERVRRGADFEKTLENILNFLRLKKERRCRKPYTVLSMLEFIPGEDSSEKKEAFWEKFAGLIDDVHLREVNSWGKLFLGTRDFRYREFHGGYVPCGRLWNTLGILWNGDVVPCIYNLNHDYVVGNVREKTLAELWNTPKIVALRQAMLNGTYLELSPLCENCTIAGTPKIFGIPAGLRASLADSLSNFLGYGFEKKAVSLANILRNGKFASRRIKFD